jgi:hypothetical protein
MAPKYLSTLPDIFKRFVYTVPFGSSPMTGQKTELSFVCVYLQMKYMDSLMYNML